MQLFSFFPLTKLKIGSPRKHLKDGSVNTTVLIGHLEFSVSLYKTLIGPTYNLTIHSRTAREEVIQAAPLSRTAYCILTRLELLLHGDKGNQIDV